MDINERQAEKLNPGITEGEFRAILEKYGTIEGEGEILEQILKTENGYEIPVKEIWGGPLLKESENPGGDETPSEPLNLKVGDYIRYNVTYTDIYTGYEFTAENGWRVLNPGTDNGNGTVTGLKIISTGIPAGLCYDADFIKNRENNGLFGNWAGNVEQREKYANDYYTSGSIDNENMYASAGLRYNFGKIKFSQGVKAKANEGYYTKVNEKISGELAEGEFLQGGGEEVHNLTLAELNQARGVNDLSSIKSVSLKDGADGLFYLRGLEKYGYDSSSKPYYWLAFPDNIRATHLECMQYIGETLATNYRTCGIRPVVSLPSDFKVEESGE